MFSEGQGIGDTHSSCATGRRKDRNERHGSCTMPAGTVRDTAPNLSLSVTGPALAVPLFPPSSLDNCVFTAKLTDGSFSVSRRQMASEEGGKSLARKCRAALLVPKLQHMPALCKAALFSSRKVQGGRAVNQ